MAFENISVLQSSVESGTLTGPGDASAMTVDLALTGVTAGSALLLVGTAFLTSGWPYVKMTSVASTGDVWTTPVKYDLGFDNGGTFFNAGRGFYAIAADADGGDTTVTVSFNGADPFSGEATQSVEAAKGVQYHLALIEIALARTAAPVDLVVSNKVTTGTDTSVTTGVLTQTDNVQVWVHGLFTSYSGVPSGFTSLLTTSNGTGGLPGTVIAHREVSSAASTTVSQTHGTVDTAVGGFLITVRAAETGGSTYRYKFLLNSSTFTSADTSVEAHVWRNGEPYAKVAERYTGLAGDGTAGILYITSGLPADALATDTIKAAIFNGTDASVGYVSGTVESV